MKSIKILTVNVLVLLFMVSCNTKPSLQKYYVENQENTAFKALDIPASIVTFDEMKLTEEQKKAYKSVKKLNFLGLEHTSDNTAMYEAEKKKVKEILADESYKTLMRFGSGKQGVIVKYLGTETEIDEVIVFGNDKTKGFGIIRVIGDDMNPKNMVSLVEAMRTADVDDSQLKEIFNFFK